MDPYASLNNFLSSNISLMRHKQLSAYASSAAESSLAPLGREFFGIEERIPLILVRPLHSYPV